MVVYEWVSSNIVSQVCVDQNDPIWVFYQMRDGSKQLSGLQNVPGWYFSPIHRTVLRFSWIEPVIDLVPQQAPDKCKQNDRKDDG
jgi:hypothetical protein